MAYEIISFLLEVAAGLLAGACLLRLYMQYQRIPFGNPVGRFVFALTDWIVLPLRKVLPSVGKWDTASIVAALLVELARYFILWLLVGRLWPVAAIFIVAAFGVLRLALYSLMMLMIVYAVLSWVRADSPVADVVDRLCAPLLRPLRRRMPLVGGIDLSPLVFMVAVQVVLIVLGSMQQAALRL
jgi:YggT family protein